MKDEYDFSKAERGRFHRPSATLAPPVQLDPKPRVSQPEVDEELSRFPSGEKE